VLHQLGKVDAGDGGLDGAERTAELGARLGVPRFELADAAVELDEQDLAGFLLKLGGKDGTRDGAEAERAKRPAADGGGEGADGAVPQQRPTAERVVGVVSWEGLAGCVHIDLSS
jgi:hypothetical protein